MRRLSLCGSSAKVIDDCIVTLQSETMNSYSPEYAYPPERMRLLLFTKDLELETMKELAKFEGYKGFILRAERDDYLVSIDNKVYRIKGEAQSIVLEAKKPEKTA